MRIVRAAAALAFVAALAGCSSSPTKVSLGWGEDVPPPANPEITGSVGAGKELAAKDVALSDAGDDLSLGKRHYREKSYTLAEQHFRRATEITPTDGEAWLGLAAAYDRLKRYDQADRAYNEAVKIYGPRAEVINNIGYSYLLRGDLKRAKQKFNEALAKDPGNPTIANNLALVDDATKRKKAIN